MRRGRGSESPVGILDGSFYMHDTPYSDVANTASSSTFTVNSEKESSIELKIEASSDKRVKCVVEERDMKV